MTRFSLHTNPADADEPLDPAILAELGALDAALRGEAIDDDQLAALVRDVQAQAAVLPDGLRKQLRHDVEQGFPRGGARGRLERLAGLGGGERGRPSRRRFALAGSGAAAVLIAGVFTASVLVDQGSVLQSDSGVATVPDASVTASSPSSGAATSGTDLERFQNSSSASSRQPPTASAPLVPRTQKLTAASGARRVEQAVQIDIRVKSGQLDEASGKVQRIVRASGGYVADSQVSLGTRGAGSATFSLKVATSKLDSAMARLAELGTVTSQQQRSTDITSSFDSVDQRIADATALRKALLRALATADTAGEIASLRSRIADNRATRASLDRQRARLSTRTNLTTVELGMNAPTGDSSTDDDGQWSLGDAAGDAGRMLATVTGVLLVFAGALLPLAILAAIGFAVYRVRRARARESALGA